MSSSLFNKPAVELPTSEGPRSEVDAAAQALDYRAMSLPAVISLVTGLFSALMFAGWAFVVLPLAGTIVGWIGLKKIQAEPDYYTGGGLAKIGIAASLFFLVSGGGWMVYDYATEVPEGYTRISYSQLRDPNLPIDGFQLPPESAHKLNNEKVFIKGYMYPPPGKQPGQKVNSFVLCRDNGDCCFGGDPPVLERISVNVPEGETVTYTTSVLKLAGTFKVLDEVPQSDRTVGYVFYTLDVEHVR